MEFFNSALGKNITFVRPAYFIISGFIGIPHVKYYYIFLCFVYIFSVLANTAVMAVICLDPNLRTPKYIIVFNLAFTDLFSNSALVPKVLDVFLFNHHHIPYNDCLTFLFFCYTCLSMQSLNLVALSYDRLIAISYPLQYRVQITHRFMFSVVASLWLSVVTVVLIVIGLLTRLSFCQSVVIRSYFCDHGQLYRLACNDITPNFIIAYLLPALILWFPLIFILCTYLSISYALSKVTTVQGRVKALKTCTAHLSLVAIYFIPIIVTFMFGRNIHPNARIINLSLSSVFPPMLNPIIYVLQTQEIKDSVRKLLKIRKKSGIKVKKVIIK
ncbi:olfactory receptor 1500-like [Hippoglossus hippoglossus]|uniref:olfactory receptor 1500-like n=1 Tax=Hippoglossus hippoglossus TaxID=8267 RepID=UPI00148CF08E|nr:olfactory receptor 1500-like [Hippoglossus hippoglossus]